MKFKHHPQTLIVLDDLDNRLQQLSEATEKYPAFKGGEQERQCLAAVRTLVKQCRNTGHVFRGSSVVPDALLPYVTTPSYKNPLKVQNDVNVGPTNQPNSDNHAEGTE